MPSFYWIKLYHEILDDAKMGRLSDRLFRRSIQFFLLAGELDDGGHLPEIQDIAWRLRCDVEQLETEMIELQNSRILSKVDGRWLVTKFVERQAPISGAERVANYRERKRKSNYYETPPLPNGNKDVTKRYTDIDIDKIRIDKEAEEELNVAAADFFNPVKILCDASGLSDFPADQREWIEVIHSLVDDHGAEKTTAAMKRACNAWVKSKSKNGRPYRLTNLNWINWAQEILAGGDLPSQGKKEMTQEEYVEMKSRELLAKSEVYDDPIP